MGSTVPLRLVWGFLHVLAFGGVAYGPEECACVRFTFNQIVLSPFAHRGEGHGLVVQAGKGPKGDFFRGMGPLHSAILPLAENLADMRGTEAFK